MVPQHSLLKTPTLQHQHISIFYITLIADTDIHELEEL